MVQPLWKTEWRFFRELKIKSLYDPAVPRLGIYPKKTKTLTQIVIGNFIFTAALLTMTKAWK